MRCLLDTKHITVCWFTNCSYWGMTRHPGYIALDAGPLTVELNW